MANVLCQIRGSKKLLLYPPEDVGLLSIPAGGSSSTMNVFNPSERERESLSQAHPQEVIMNPGDVLYLPPMWLHAAEPLDGHSVAVNVFFRNLHGAYALGRDVYGNRDLRAYEEGRTGIKKIFNRFKDLPPSIRAFYVERLASELRDKLRET
jgi:tRNA wybutosine-synthesizing protein 4